MRYHAGVRRSEWVLAIYFAYTAALAAVLPARAPLPAVLATLNLTIVAGFALAAYADSFRRTTLLGALRDILTLALLLLAYREIGWFAGPPDPRLHRLFIAWDRVLLRDWGVHRAIEILGPALPALLEMAYSLVYALAPFGVAMLYVYRRPKRVDQFLFPVVLSVLLCYAQFPLWPSEPPRTVFPGEDFPGWNTIFRQFNWWMLGGQGIHTSVFPSAHVAGGFSAALSMRRALPEHRWVGRLLLLLAALIAMAVVYGRYHYLADAVAGFAMALAGVAVSRRLSRNERRRASSLPKITQESREV